jgi:hypothetical protein
MERWNWFLSATFVGKWIITNGYAEVVSSQNKISAVLRFAPDADPHAYVDCKHNDAGDIDAVVKPFNPDTPHYTLKGVINTGDHKVTSIILTDGYTVIGLTKGPRADEANLA